jgi:hypothetical protein
MCDRIFVEWYDPDRPDWGGYVNSECSDFQAALVDFVARCGPPTLVEFRAAGTGYAPPSLCEDCGLRYAKCKCDGYEPPEPSESVKFLGALHDHYLEQYGHLLEDKP